MASAANLTGALLINKPAGLTSHDIVNQVRHLLPHQRPALKVGHTGTLDPFATGLLIVAIGPATRLIQYTHALAKTYEVKAILGASSTTDDATGTISPLPSAPNISQNDIDKILPSFIGKITQVPPAYSAIKVNGQPLYRLAHKGRLAEAQALAGERGRQVDIYDIQIKKFLYPELDLVIKCGTGTYIRSLVRDIAQALGTLAYAHSLCRVNIGGFHINDPHVIHKLSTGFLHTEYLLSADKLVSHLPSILLNKANVAQFQQGRALLIPSKLSTSYQHYAVFYPQDKILGIGEYSPTTGLLNPKVVFPVPDLPNLEI